jgi:hypothetical protein
MKKDSEVNVTRRGDGPRQLLIQQVQVQQNTGDFQEALDALCLRYTVR